MTRIQRNPKKRTVDPRSLAAASFADLQRRCPHYARGMLWLRAFWLMKRPSLCAILWPNGTTRQNHNHGLRQLVLHDLIEPNDEQGRVYRLGQRGAALMQAHGIEARYRASRRRGLSQACCLRASSPLPSVIL
jgi:hypothetical protein